MCLSSSAGRNEVNINRLAYTDYHTHTHTHARALRSRSRLAQTHRHTDLRERYMHKSHSIRSPLEFSSDRMRASRFVAESHTRKRQIYWNKWCRCVRRLVANAFRWAIESISFSISRGCDCRVLLFRFYFWFNCRCPCRTPTPSTNSLRATT